MSNFSLVSINVSNKVNSVFCFNLSCCLLEFGNHINPQIKPHYLNNGLPLSAYHVLIIFFSFYKVIFCSVKILNIIFIIIMYSPMLVLVQ